MSVISIMCVRDRSSLLVNITVLFTKIYQKLITLTSKNSIENKANGFVHGKYITISGLSLHL